MCFYLAASHSYNIWKAIQEQVGMAERQIFENMGRRAAQTSLLGRLMIIPLAAAYDVTSGNLWLPVAGCTGCAPWLTAKMRGMA